jgi:hypothetical protein
MKSLLKLAARCLGLEIHRVPPGIGLAEYERIYPIATYSPWNADRQFLETWQAVKACTL